jgi:hypothetical protein
MGPGEVMAILATTFIAVVVIAALFATYSRRLQFKQRKLELEASRAEGAASPALDRVAQLEDRVRVLERIATDRGQIASAELAARIEDLRNPVPVKGELQ